MTIKAEGAHLGLYESGRNKRKRRACGIGEQKERGRKAGFKAVERDDRPINEKNTNKKVQKKLRKDSQILLTYEQKEWEEDHGGNHRTANRIEEVHGSTQEVCKELLNVDCVRNRIYDPRRWIGDVVKGKEHVAWLAWALMYKILRHNKITSME